MSNKIKQFQYYISNDPHGHIIYDYDDLYGNKYWIILEINGKKEKIFLFSDSHDEKQLPHNSGVNAITDFPIGHYGDFSGYFADIPIDSKALGITRDYITNNLRCYTNVNKYGNELEMYYLIVNYNNQNYCFYLEDDKDVLIDYLLNEQYFHYIEHEDKHDSFYQYLKNNYGIDDTYTQCMTLLSY